MKNNQRTFNPIRDKYYHVIFFTGLILNLWQILIFRATIIKVEIPLLIILTTGIVATAFDYKYFKKTYPYKGFKRNLTCFGLNLFGWGFTISSLFLILNKHFPQNNPQKDKYQIVKYSSMLGSKKNRSKLKPTFTIKYKGKRKQLIFSNKYYKNRMNYNFIEFETQKGLFGYDVIKNKRLLEQ